MGFFDGEEGAAKLVLVANVFLISSKLAVVLWTGSIGVFAVLVDSIFDLAGGLFAYFGIRKAQEPPDHNHYYGHKKYGALSGLAQLTLIFLTAFFILFEPADRFFESRPLAVTQLDLAVLLCTILVNILMSRHLSRKAREYGSSALSATAGNYSSDILQNSVVLVALFGSSLGYYQLDAIAAVIVALLMIRIVYLIGSNSVRELTDGGPDDKVISKISRAILSQKGVLGFHKLRARSYAGGIYVDVHLQFPDRMSLRRAHEISGAVKYAVMAAVPQVREVLVHEEPLD